MELLLKAFPCTSAAHRKIGPLFEPSPFWVRHLTIGSNGRISIFPSLRPPATPSYGCLYAASLRYLRLYCRASSASGLGSCICHRKSTFFPPRARPLSFQYTSTTSPSGNPNSEGYDNVVSPVSSSFLATDVYDSVYHYCSRDNPGIR